MSFVDGRGVRHSVSVYASSVLEAAAAGLKQIRETEMIEDEGVFDLTVGLITTTSRKVSLSKLKAWLESSGRDPREAAVKNEAEMIGLDLRNMWKSLEGETFVPKILGLLTFTALLFSGFAAAQTVIVQRNVNLRNDP